MGTPAVSKDQQHLTVCNNNGLQLQYLDPLINWPVPICPTQLQLNSTNHNTNSASLTTNNTNSSVISDPVDPSTVIELAWNNLLLSSNADMPAVDQTLIPNCPSNLANPLCEVNDNGVYEIYEQLLSSSKSSFFNAFQEAGWEGETVGSPLLKAASPLQEKPSAMTFTNKLLDPIQETPLSNQPARLALFSSSTSPSLPVSLDESIVTSDRDDGAGCAYRPFNQGVPVTVVPSVSQDLSNIPCNSLLHVSSLPNMFPLKSHNTLPTQEFGNYNSGINSRHPILQDLRFKHNHILNHCSSSLLHGSPSIFPSNLQHNLQQQLQPCHTSKLTNLQQLSRSTGDVQNAAEFSNNIEKSVEGTSEVAFKRRRVDQSTPSAATLPYNINNKPQVRKEKLGDRITALQQLVSPFGKTDTASVLLEAIGYIKFLQDQVQVLSNPYMKRPSWTTTASHIDTPKRHWNKEKSMDIDEPKRDLRSRGLCLIPLSCTQHVANDIGADYWSSTIGGHFQ